METPHKTLTAALTAVALSATPALATDWRAGDIADPLLGVVGKSARLVGSVEHSGRQDAALMTVQCVNNSTAVYFEMATGFARFYRPVTRYRLDDQPVKSLPTQNSDDRKAFGVWSGGGIAFLKTVAGAKVLKLEVTDTVDAAKHVFTFHTAGDTAALDAAAKACNWNAAPVTAEQIKATDAAQAAAATKASQAAAQAAADQAAAIAVVEARRDAANKAFKDILARCPLSEPATRHTITEHLACIKRNPFEAARLNANAVNSAANAEIAAIKSRR